MGHGLTSVLLVALGGALGGMGRFGVSNLMARWWGKAFPWGTLVVNASGAFIAGYLLASLGIPNAQPSLFGYLWWPGCSAATPPFRLLVCKPLSYGRAVKRCALRSMWLPHCCSV